MPRFDEEGFNPKKRIDNDFPRQRGQAAVRMYYTM